MRGRLAPRAIDISGESIHQARTERTVFRTKGLFQTLPPRAQTRKVLFPHRAITLRCTNDPDFAAARVVELARTSRHSGQIFPPIPSAASFAAHLLPPCCNVKLSYICQLARKKRERGRGIVY